MRLGYFKTGDVTRYDAVLNSYAILGRASADIIKTSGYKVSALEIERSILDHPRIAEAAVVGVDDIEKGQLVAAVIVCKDGAAQPSLEELRKHLSDGISIYKMPTLLKVITPVT